MAVMGDLLDKILIPLRPQSAPTRNERDSISEEKCDAGWLARWERIWFLHRFIGYSYWLLMIETSRQGGEVETVASTPEKTKESDHSIKSTGGGKITRPWDLYLEENKGKWKELSIKGDDISTSIF